MFWNIFIIIDWTLFVIISLTVFYFGFFAFLSLFTRHSETPSAKNQNRFIVLIPSYRSGKSVEMTVNSILGQDYPQRLFDVTVIADHESEMTKFHLAQQPVTLLTPDFEKSTRTKSFQLAVNNLPQFKIYDVAVILEAGDMVETDFLTQMNEAYEAAGTKAIQAHKLSFNRDTTSARLSAVFEEINNSIFRRGHITLGLSAALDSSGMAFDFAWFKQQMQNAKPTWTNKELEAQLLRQHIYVDYFDNVYVYNEKVRQADDFNRQHRHIIANQFQSILRNIRYLPIALLNRHYDLADKLLQWLLVPRMLLMIIVVGMSLITPIIYFTSALKWWGIFAVILFIFALATPNYLVDDKWDTTFFKVPFVLLQPVLTKFKLGRLLLQKINIKQ